MRETVLERIHDMGDVVSLGSINVDKIHHVSDTEIKDLRNRYSGFPDRNQTVQIDDLTTNFPADSDSIRHGGEGSNRRGCGEGRSRN